MLWRPACRSAVFIACAAASCLAQAQAPAVPPVDPYTSGEPAAMARVGYPSFGPFRFGQLCTSEDVQKLLADEPLLWLETSHFRIGSALPELACASERDKDRRGQQREELRQLAARLPTVKPDAGRLDPWLRLHLLGSRAEQIYADVSRNLGCSDGDFPAAPGDDPRDAARFRGLGPFLGNPQKFTILLLQRTASLQRYTAAYQGWATGRPTTHHDHAFGTAFFGACLESDGGLLRDDLALHTHLAYHVAHNLYTSYRAYGHNLPAWLVTGLAHRHARAVSTRYPIYDLRPAGDPDGQLYAAWERRRGVLLREGRFEPLATFVARMDVKSFTMDDHLQCWAFVDWLMTSQPQATMRFLSAMKDPFHGRMRFPTDEELLLRQQQAMARAFGADAAGLEQAWRRAPVPFPKR
ncbi:MAG: hypothetical protein FJ265_16370 [Planctomycetes bacterium]|nr:hypothetical protein [Planctomycetota bacterium]